MLFVEKINNMYIALEKAKKSRLTEAKEDIIKEDMQALRNKISELEEAFEPYNPRIALCLAKIWWMTVPSVSCDLATIEDKLASSIKLNQ